MRRRDPDEMRRPPRRTWRAGTGPRGRYSVWALLRLLTGALAVTIAAALVGGTLTVYFNYRSDWEAVKRVRVHDLGVRPPKLNNALNILLIGSDSRTGGHNAKLGGYTPGQRSDTVIIVHLSPGGKRAIVLSIPRDSVVPYYQCDSAPGFAGQLAQPAGYVEQINSTFAAGGPSCLWKTIEHTTGIHIDDFIEIDFTGFVHIINALGGVEVCLPYAVSGLQYDPTLHLAAGLHHIWGVDALDFWRAREGLGLGSDLQRIQRDQLLLISLLHGLMRERVLSSYGKTSAVLQATADALTTDTDLTQDRLLHIAESLRGISSADIQFIEVPTVAYPQNPNWVQWAPQAAQLFSAIAHDDKVLSPPRKHGKAAPVKLLSPANVTVQVLNGSGVAGIAGTAAAALTARGFRLAGTGDAPSFGYTRSVVEYGSAATLAAADTVAAQVSAASVRKVSGVIPGQVVLILGSTFKALKAKASSPGPSGNLAGQYGGYTGSTNICRNGSAFQQ